MAMRNLWVFLTSLFYLVCPVDGWRGKSVVEVMQGRPWNQEEGLEKAVNATGAAPCLAAVACSASKRRVNTSSTAHPLRSMVTLLFTLNPATGFQCSAPGAPLHPATPACARSHPALMRLHYDLPEKKAKKKKKKKGMRSEQRKDLEEMEKALKSHCGLLMSALQSELEEDVKSSEIRLTEWPRWLIVKKGYACLGLIAREKPELFYMDAIVRFSTSNGKELPFNRFTTGDLVRVRLDDKEQLGVPADGENDLTGIVVDRNKHSIRVSFGMEKIALVTDQSSYATWRLDMMTNTVTAQRKEDAVMKFASPKGFPDEKDNRLFSPLHRALVGVQVGDKSPKVLAAHPATWKGKTRPSKERQDMITKAIQKLNPSQRDAVKAGLSRTLTLWQGPPGTGKTETTCALISTAVSLLADGGTRGPRVLASAASNVAVDNILMGLLRLPEPPNVVRVGSPASVTSTLRDYTLEAKIAKSELAKNASEFRELAALQRSRGFVEEAWDCSEKARRLQDGATLDVLRSADVVLATCVSSVAGFFKDLQFSFCIIDEATQATEPDVLIALSKAHAAVLVGDPAQLPATVLSSAAQEAGLCVSLFERLVAQGVPPLLLDTQYRMHPGLAEFSSKNFYDGRIKSHPQPSDRIPPAGLEWPSQTVPAAFFQCNANEERKGTTYTNPTEANVVVRIVRSLLESGSLTSLDDVGIVTPYLGQVRLLHERFSSLGYATSMAEDREFVLESTGSTNQSMGIGQLPGALEIRSVDAYQGREKEVMVFSTVRSNQQWGLGFVADKRRLNVAITRARRGLIVVGNAHTLKEDPTWKDWLDWVKEQGAFATLASAIPPDMTKTASPPGLDSILQSLRARKPIDQPKEVSPQVPREFTYDLKSLLGSLHEEDNTRGLEPVEQRKESSSKELMGQYLDHQKTTQRSSPVSQWTKEISKSRIPTEPGNGVANADDKENGFESLPDSHDQDDNGQGPSETPIESADALANPLSELLDLSDNDGKLDVTLNGLPAEFLEGEQWQRTLASLVKMREAGVTLQLSEFSTAISACEEGGQWEQAVALLRDMISTGLKPELSNFNDCMLMCDKFRQWQEVLSLLEEMRTAGMTLDARSFTTASSACAQGGQWQCSLTLLRDMQVAGITPDSIRLCSAISACGKGGQWHQALLLVDGMSRMKIAPTVFSYNAAISACGQNGRWEQALSLLARMSSEDVMPTEFSFNQAILACEKSNQFEHAASLGTDKARILEQV